jgi:PAS domain S-box-containing protein
MTEEHSSVNSMPLSFDIAIDSKKPEISSIIINEWYKFLLTKSTDGFFITDTTGRFLEVNDKFCSMSGYSREELLNMGLYDIVVNNDKVESPQSIGHHFQKMKNHGENYCDIKKVKHRRKNGEIIIVSTNCQHTDIAGGLVFHFNRDITQEIRMLEKLKESEELYRALVDLGGKVGEAIVMTESLDNLQAKHLFVSEKWIEMTGYSKDELLKMSFFDLIVPQYIDTLVKRHERRMQGISEPELLEVSFIRKDATEVPISITSGHSIFHGDTVDVIYIRDMTDLKKMQANLIETISSERAMRESERAKNAFLSMISHELRTPLASIKGFSSSLLQPDVTWEENEKLDFIKEIDMAADHLSRLVNDLLDMSSIGEQTFTLNKTPCSIESILKEAQHSLTKVLENHRFKMDIQDNLPLALCDKVRIIQVIYNLIDNATKFSPSRTQITLSAYHNEGYIVISIADQGIGISPEDQDNIFNRFYQAEKITSGEKQGTGLGLSICKEIVERHNGRIWVNSQKGKGSVFSFTLPVMN